MALTAIRATTTVRLLGVNHICYTNAVLAQKTARASLRAKTLVRSPMTQQRNVQSFAASDDAPKTSTAPFPATQHKARHVKLANRIVNWLGFPPTAFTRSTLAELETEIQESDATTIFARQLEISPVRDLALARPEPRTLSIVFYAVFFAAAAISTAAWYTVGQAHDMVEKAETEARVDLAKRQEQWAASGAGSDASFPMLTVVDLWLPYSNLREKLQRHEKWAATLSRWTGFNLMGLLGSSRDATGLAYEGPGFVMLLSYYVVAGGILGLAFCERYIPKNDDIVPAKPDRVFRWHKFMTHYIRSGKLSTLITSNLATKKWRLSSNIGVALLFFSCLGPFVSTLSHGNTFRQIVIKDQAGRAAVVEDRTKREMLQASNIPHLFACLATVSVASAAAAHLYGAAAWHLAMRRGSLPKARYIASIGLSQNFLSVLGLFYLGHQLTSFAKDYKNSVTEPEKNKFLMPIDMLAFYGTLALCSTIPGLVVVRYRMTAVASSVVVGMGALHGEFGEPFWNACKTIAYRVRYGAEREEAMPLLPNEALLAEIDVMTSKERTMLQEHHSVKGPSHNETILANDWAFGSHDA